MGNFKAIGAGMLSAAAVAAIVAIIFAGIGYNVLSYYWWDYVPVGAIACGFLAGIGLYAACLYFNVRATPLLLIVTVAMALTTQFFVYALEYWLTAKGPDSVPFWTFVDRAFTGSKLGVNVGRYSVGLGEVGPLGYLTAAIETLGFCAGGWLVYAVLKSHPWCEACQAYFRTVARKKSYFRNGDQFKIYWEGTSDLQRPEALALLAGDYSGQIDAEGAIYLATDFNACRGCGERLMSDTGQVYSGGKWSHDLGIERKVPIPAGFDLESVAPPTV